ncbi:MAG: beta-ketoacyl-[acyl-carrier-protein] synthase family protein [Nitrospirota bacterium]|nr:beta-ketoacyl-[acyl-carrier-protein] synthase family protein [Nitrospirota bacterium]
MTNARVAISGVGAVTAIGVNKDEYFSRLLNGESGIATVRYFDTSIFSTNIAGQIDRERLGFYFEKETGRPYEEYDQSAIPFAAVAIKEALSDASLAPSDFRQKRTALVLATAAGGINCGLAVHELYFHKKLAYSDLGMAKKYPFHSLTAELSDLCGIGGYSVTNISACTSSNAAIAYAFDLIKSGLADVAITGGMDILSPFEFSCFNAYRALAREACRPFDKNREGLVLSEGAAMLVLEPFETAVGRKGVVEAEIGGYGITNDAVDMTAPDAAGVSAAEAMRKALAKADADSASIGYVAAHGTGTKLNDVAETAAIKNVFGKRAYDVPVSSVKGAIGHMNGAAGAIGAVTCVMSLSSGFIPPTINYQTPDEACDLDYVPNAARSSDVQACLSNSYAFGGQCSSLLIRKAGDRTC